MDHNAEASISKILLDYSEYERLKHIEALYIAQNKNKVNQQIGGANENSLNEEFEYTSNQVGTGISVVPPTAEREVENFSKLQTPSNVPLLYDIGVKKDDLNQTFDENQLLALIPKKFQKNAKILLKEFDERGQELTWNSSGTVFVNQVSLPGSNIFVLFPLLFKKNHYENYSGFKDFVQKIHDMGLSDLIVSKSLLQSFEPNQITGGANSITSEREEPKNVPWWYIGD